MKGIVVIFLILCCINAYSQNSTIKMINLTKAKIEFSFIDSAKTNETYRRVICNKNLSYYITENESVYINPFSRSNRDTIINKQLLDFIKTNYDYEKARKRQAFGSPIEALTLVIKVDTTGLITNYGFCTGSNEKLFEKEIYKILENENFKQIVYPFYMKNGKKYSYIKTYQITNYALYDNK